MDDDVQYIGTRLALSDDADSLTGITLHVDKCGDKPAHQLTFLRACSGCVNIGRKSGSDDRSMRKENDDHNAVFSCQVVSARHAKLVFSNGGQVYIVDLYSRHGTHLLRRGEAPRALLPQVETLLADGDVLTFGKVVGAGSYHVSPVSVRVELLNSTAASEPTNVRAATPFDPPPSPVLSRPRQLCSGRYGLLSQAAYCLETSDSPHSSVISVSSDAVSSSSEVESDVDDDDACVPAVLRDPQGKTLVKMPAFRSFIREIYHNAVVDSPEPEEVVEAPAGTPPPGTPPPADAVKPPSPTTIMIEPSADLHSHSPMEVATPSPSPSLEAQQSEPAVIGAWPASRPESPRHSSLEVETGRSEVPLAPEPERVPEPVLPPTATCTNRHSSPNPSLSNETPAGQTPLRPPLGACHLRFPPNPSQSSGAFVGRLPQPLSADPLLEFIDFSSPIPLPPSYSVPLPPPPVPLSLPQLLPQPRPVPLPPSSLPQLLPQPRPIPQPLPLPPSLSPQCPAPPFNSLLRHLATQCVTVKGSLKNVEDRVTALHETMHNLKSRQTVTEEDVVDLQSHVETLEPDSERLLCRITSAERNIATLSTLQGHMAALQQQVATLRDRMDAPEAKVIESPMDDVRACAAALSGLVLEMRALREDVEKRMETKLDAIQQARTEAVSALKEVVVEAESARSLKRKRVEDVVEEDDEEREVVVPMHGVEASEDSCTLGVEMPTPSEVHVPQPHPVPIAEVSAPEPSRPQKRVRTALYTVAHTAAAVAIGAAATWSALAFS